MFRQPQAFNRADRQSSRRPHRYLFSCADSLESRLLLAATAQPTNYEQYMLELINRARATPATEASLYGIDVNEGIGPADTITSIPKQPLAFNLSLVDAAQNHAQDMLSRNYFSQNTLGTGEDPGTRMANSGYVFNGDVANGWAENIGWSPALSTPNATLASIHQKLFVDASSLSRTDRLNLENGDFKEVGVGIATGTFSPGGASFNNADLASIDFAYNNDSTSYLTGVAYHDDVNTDWFYEPGEGYAGLKIQAVSDTNGRVFTTTTFSSGGYTLALPADTYTVTASGSALATPMVISNVVMGVQNQKLDFINSPAPKVTINQADRQSDPTDAIDPTTSFMVGLPINFTVVFSKPVTGFAGTSHVVLSGTAGATTAVITSDPIITDGTTYNVAVSGMTGPGTIIATVPLGAARDAAGNFSLASTSTDNTVTYNPFAPAVTINQAAGQTDPTNATTINYTVVFDKPVTGFTNAGVRLAGTAGATTIVVTGSGTTYNVAVSGMVRPGTVIATIPENIATTAGNVLNFPSTSIHNTVTFDNVAPNVAITLAAGQANQTNAATINFTVVLDKPVVGFTGANVSLGGTAGATTAVVTGGGITSSGFTYNVAVSGMTRPGTVIISFVTGALVDAAGNGNPAAFSPTVNFDNARPTVTIDQAAGQLDPSNASPVNFTVVFSKPVTGFTNSDITLGGTAGANTAVVTGSGNTYNVAVSGMTGPGTVIASIPVGAASDAAGNLSLASTSTDHTVTFDSRKPLVTVVQAAGQADPTNAATINFTVVFSKPVTGFAGNDVVIGGTAGATTAIVTADPIITDGTTYNVVVSGMTQPGTVLVTVPAGAAIDGTGNVNVASTSVDNVVTFDNVQPSVLVSPASGQGTSTRASTINYTVLFSKPVTGFTASGVNLGGSAGAATVVVTGSGSTYNVAVSDMAQNGTITLNVLAGAATDAAGNANLASTGLNNTLVYDTTPPTVTIDQALLQADPTNAPAIHYTVVFSEAVGGFSGHNVVLGGTAGATMAIVTGGGTTYDVAVSGMTTTGTVIATIPAFAATDAAGNFSLDSTSTDNTVNFDKVPPTVTINKAAGQADPTDAATINFTIVFSKPVTGFVAGDVVIGGTAGANHAVLTGSGATYNLALSGMSQPGTVIPSIPARVAQDAAGNGNTFSTSTHNNVFWGRPATLTVQPAAYQSNPGSSAINFTVVFSRPVTGFTGNSIILSGTAVPTMATVTGSGTTYNVAVLGMSQTGSVVIEVKAGAAVDANGLPTLASAGPSNPVTFDNVAPTALLRASTLTVPSRNRYAFSVIYNDNIAVNAATIGNGNLIVTGPKGINYKAGATWIKPANPLANGLSVTASYSILPPGGSWDTADNGVYTVILQYHRISDIAGNQIAASKGGQVIGTFRVNISRTSRTLIKTAASVLPSVTPSPTASIFATGGKRIGVDVWD